MPARSRDSGSDSSPSGVSRRAFMAGAAAASFSIVKPGSVRGTQANSRIRLGLIGCGMRGRWISNLFAKHGGYEIFAVADYFQDRVAYMGEKFDIPTNRLHASLSGYKRLLDQRPDAVAIESPPYYHPEHAAAAVDAGACRPGKADCGRRARLHEGTAGSPQGRDQEPLLSGRFPNASR